MLIVIIALIGLLAGGLPGLVIGLVVGYLLRWVLGRALRRGLVLVQQQFLDSTFAVMGALCKADGVVTRNEIKTVEALFQRLHLNAQQRESAKAAFQRGKAPDYDLDADLVKLARVCRGRGPMLQMFLQLQLSAIAADGQVHPAEHDLLVRVARGLGLSEADVAQLEALLRASGTGPSSRDRLQDAYAALGVDASASDDEVKRAFRRLMSRNHPDKIAGRGMPESMRELAEEKSREINTAYNLIKDKRGMS